MLRLAVIAAILAVGLAVKCNPACELSGFSDAPSYFFNFGPGTTDLTVPKGRKDTHAVLDQLLPAYKYRGNNYHSLTISVNGYAVWGEDNYDTWAPWDGTDDLYEVDMMAPYWVRGSTLGPNSEVYYRKSTDAGLISQFKDAVADARGKGAWTPEELIVVTWFNIDSYHNPCTPPGVISTKSKFGPNTFQLVVGTRSKPDENDVDQVQTMAMFNYAKICYTTKDQCMIGFNHKQFGARYWFDGSFSEKCRDIVNYGNPVKGQYVFRIDSWKPQSEEPDCRKPLGWFIRDYDWDATRFVYDVCAGAGNNN